MRDATIVQAGHKTKHRQLGTEDWGLMACLQEQVQFPQKSVLVETTEASSLGIDPSPLVEFTISSRGVLLEWPARKMVRRGLPRISFPIRSKKTNSISSWPSPPMKQSRYLLRRGKDINNSDGNLIQKIKQHQIYLGDASVELHPESEHLYAPPNGIDDFFTDAAREEPPPL